MARLSRTAAALVVYDAGEAARYDAMMASRNNDEWDACVKAYKDAGDLVREAFAEDTADVNSRDRAFLVHPNDPWLRQQVAKHS